MTVLQHAVAWIPMPLLAIGAVILFGVLMFGYLLLRGLYVYYVRLGHIPGPRRDHWLAGHFFLAQKAETGSMQTMLRAQFGRIFRFPFWTWSRVVVCDPEAIKRVLVTNVGNYLKNEPAYERLRVWVGNSLLTVTDPTEHAHQRRLLNPAFTASALRDLMPIFDAQADRLIARWSRAAAEGKSVAAHADLTRMTVDVIGLSALNLDFGAQADTNSGSHTLGSTLSTIFSRILSTFHMRHTVLFLPYGIYLPLPVNRLRRRLIAEMDAEVMRMIADRRRELEEKPPAPGTRQTILDLLLRMRDEDGRALSDRQLRDQTVTFLLAGHETTSTALAWCLELLSTRPDVQQRLQRELDETLGSWRDGSHPSVEQLEHMPYLNAVLKETLRHRPPVPIVIRRTVHDDQLGAYRIPAGTTIIVAVYAMHHDPELYPEPDEFRPERWLPGGSAADAPQEHFQPFISGPRNCIGHRFAVLEAKLALAKVLHRFCVAKAPDAPPVQRRSTITMRPTPDVFLTLTERA